MRADRTGPTRSGSSWWPGRNDAPCARRAAVPAARPTAPGTGPERAGSAIARPPERAEEATLSLTIVPTPIRGPAIAEAYLDGDSRALPFFHAHFSDREAYQRKMAEVGERFSREELRTAVEAVRSPEGFGDPRLARLVEEGGGFVATGQQPGIFGGPLYTLYKAVTAVALAGALEEELGVPILPLFWIASEDHDWEEVAEVRVPDPGNRLTVLRLPRPDGEGEEPPARSIHRSVPGAEVEELLSSFLAALPSTDFSEPLEALLRSAYTPGRPLNESFRQLLHGLPGLAPLLTVDAADPALKRATLPVLLRELDDSEATEAMLGNRVEELERAGYAGQAPVLPGAVNLFLDGPRGRERLFRADGGFRLRHSEERLDRAGIERRVENDPAVLSPNVFLRPVVESRALPVVASVTGPGETAYWAQLEPLFRHHGMAMPVIHPRFSGILVERKVEKVLRKFELEADELSRPHHELAGRIARDQLPEAAADALGGLRRALGAEGDALLRAVKEIDPTLRDSADQARRQAFHAFEELEKKLLRSLKRQNETALEQLAKARLHLFPEGRPQERMINPFYYLFRYGPELVESLEAEAGKGLLSPSVAAKG